MHALDVDPPDPGRAPHLRRFAALYRDEFAYVWSVARHLGVPPAVIEDLVQDVFLTAFRRIDHLRYEVSPRAWLFGVTRRVAFRYRRGAARRARQRAALAEAARPPGAAPQQRQDDAWQLERLLAGLSATSRAVWEMTELLGMSAPEIASELGVPLNTVYSRLRLARSQLQALADAAGLDALRDAARRGQAPPDGAQRRSWALILPVLGDPGPGAAAVAWLKARTAMATTWLATGTVAVGLVVAAGPSPTPSAPPGPPPARAGRLAAAAPASASTPRPVELAEPVAASASPRGVERAGPARTAPPASDAGARLREEIALIDRARLQVAADDGAAALATLAMHARRFPAGIFADIREAAHIDVLCRRGDAAAAEALARRLRVDYPDSAVAQRFAEYRCPP